MTARLVEVINPNGQKGLVAEGSDAALHYPRVKSTAHIVFDHNGVPLVDDADKETSIVGDPAVQLVDEPEPAPESEDTRPAKNASTEDWRAYATSPAGGMSEEDAAALSRDELVEYFSTADVDPDAVTVPNEENS